MELIEKIKYQVPIANLARRLAMKTQGKGLQCPFCPDPECTLELVEEKNRFQCTVCRAQGAQLELTQKVKGFGIDETMRYLCREYGIEEDRLKADSILKQWQSERKGLTLDSVFGSGTSAGLGAGKKSEDYEIYAELLKRAPMAEVAEGFLLRRGFQSDLIRRLRVGWVGSPGHVLEELGRRFGNEALRSAGLMDRKSELLFNRHRLLFPFFKRDQVVFIRARRIDDGKPQYLSLTRKTPILYPHDVVATLKEGETVYLTPDLAECFVLMNRGLKALAVVESQVFPEGDLEALMRFDLVAMGGMDPEGHKFNRWLLKVFARWKKDLRVQDLPQGFESWNDFLLQAKR